MTFEDMVFIYYITKYLLYFYLNFTSLIKVTLTF